MSKICAVCCVSESSKTLTIKMFINLNCETRALVYTFKADLNVLTPMFHVCYIVINTIIVAVLEL